MNKGMTVEQHLRRYHKKWLEDYLEEAIEIARKEFAGEDFAKDPMLRLKVPMFLPMCRYFQERLHGGGWTDWTFVWDPIKGVRLEG